MDNQRPDTIESKPQSQSWDELNNHSLDLSEEDLISIYNKLREKHEIAENIRYYPNIKHLHATPFERKKDCAEQGRLCKESSAHTEVAQWYREKETNPASGGLKITLSPSRRIQLHELRRLHGPLSGSGVL